ncbi:MAG TPA: HD domain-containing phosphohydrolase, partial [Anaerolineae bacterium]|nr:HD domain-containing phosphohydrolase [Anaerolineae bacterium]
GYPFGLKGKEIHPYSKICCLADAFEALTGYRPYRPGNKKNMSSFDALLKLKNEMSEEIDPHFFQQFVLLFSNINTSNLKNGK